MKHLVIALLSFGFSLPLVFGQTSQDSVVNNNPNPGEQVRDTFVIKYNLSIEIDSAERPYRSFPTDVKKTDAKITPQSYNSKERRKRSTDNKQNQKVCGVTVKSIIQSGDSDFVANLRTLSLINQCQALKQKTELKQTSNPTVSIQHSLSFCCCFLGSCHCRTIDHSY